MFRRMDDDGSKALSFEEFSNGITETGMHIFQRIHLNLKWRKRSKFSRGHINLNKFY